MIRLEGPSVSELYNITTDEAQERYRASSSESRETPCADRDTVHGNSNSNDRYQSEFEKSALVSLLCPTAYQTQLLSNWIHSISTPRTSPNFQNDGVWLGDVASRSKQSCALVWAIRSVAVSHLARQAADERLIQTARRIYGKALIKLNRALQNSDEGLSSDTLSATIFLSFYEIFNCTGRCLLLAVNQNHTSRYLIADFYACNR